MNSEDYSNRPSQDWSRLPGNRIALVTQDALLDARIRDLFSDEKRIKSTFVTLLPQRDPFEIVTVSDFFLHQKELASTKLGIIDARLSDAQNTIQRIRDSSFWGEYPLIKLIPPKQIEWSYRDVMCSCFGSVVESEFADLLNYSIRITTPPSTEDDDKAYRI